MESTKIKPLDVLSESQLSEIRKKNDLRNKAVFSFLFLSFSIGQLKCAFNSTRR